MAVNLSKGQRVSLDKGMKMALIGLGWDVNQYDGGADFDLDASAFLLGANGKVRKDEDFIFYGNLDSSDGSVHHTGDNLTGEGEGDDEVLVIDFSKIPPDIDKIAITVTIYEAPVRRQNFGQVSNARRLRDLPPRRRVEVQCGGRGLPGRTGSPLPRVRRERLSFSGLLHAGVSRWHPIRHRTSRSDVRGARCAAALF